jgi:hypothetical protein
MKPTIKSKPIKFKIGLCNPSMDMKIHYFDIYNKRSFSRWNQLIDVAQHLVDHFDNDFFETMDAKLKWIEDGEIQLAVLIIKLGGPSQWLYFPIFTHDLLIGPITQKQIENAIEDHYNTVRVFRG